MAIEVVQMPQLGESVTEGTISQWLKNVGDPVEKYESLLEVLTDKVNAEVPAPVTGRVAKILVDAGATVPVGTPICEIEVEGADTGEAEPAPATTDNKGAQPVESPVTAASETASPASSDGRGRYSPAVRRLAKEYGIDPATVAGTGAGGRVTRDDILKAATNRPSAQAAPAQPPVSAPAPQKEPVAAPAITPIPAVIDDGDTVEPLAPIRKVIAERMVRSKQTVPHAWLMVEVDVTGLALLRQRLKDEFKAREGVSLTYLPFMMRAVVEALRAVPQMNAQWNGDSIVYKKRINLGMATATDRGLIVPVVKDADQKNIVGLAKATQELTQKARAGRLTMDDLSGGTFTVDNTGAVGTVLTYPVINAPEVGIVTLESVVKRPMVVGDMIAVRSMVNICLSFDHRVVDGAEAGKFLQVIKKHLESIGPDTSIY
ncbi:lipoamide acyltransferase component of branched-chain alpha-keto acid dehydrogenase complex [Sulfobacillus acidophilus TPY]|uniref:Dihydrolipoamide acetyltransferase component of pyruvate dehydrogenase complex n=1 Tax=Sulfobacillus acidophilus (strain ATCC 700253 / DSM 10332 / NAL) TaxID=679936 RepID=G8TUF5_SULAD|nr:lipoamide acyltransferase component of branched-chain alpha-keto acid dehydrogenase complex [Sulfobacillus acidophilus TPY]AEW06917.1 Dihydrolipoyllysine-residue acetyltransferase [Sulfobacillus acidophilus DSM 10332]